MKDAFFRRAAALALSVCLLAGCAAGQPASSASGESAPEPAPAEKAESGLFPQGEYRAMWVSYLEWQSVDFSSAESFTADAAELLDNCLTLGLNTVIAQVRPFGDALYPSELFPWSEACTGRQGGDPGYDPLAILLEEAHSRGLQLEAWVNPYRLRLHSKMPAGELAPDNPAHTHPEWVKAVGEGLYLDPSSPQVRAYITAGVVELLENYALDGVHFDDYFYPTADPSFDEAEYAAAGTELSLEDWRRENVNALVRQVYAAVQEAGGGRVRFGISPQGNNDNNYQQQYSDVALWLATPGYADYVAPQLYWGNSHTLASGSDRFAFGNVAAEWAALPRAEGVKLIFGLGAYRIGEGDGCEADEAFWQSGDALARQALLGRETGGDGFSLYRYDFLFKNAPWQELAASEAAALAGLDG